jgi:NADH-quinone oxidoreductase subunit L
VTLAAADPFFLRYAFLMPTLMGVSFLTILLFGKRMRWKGAEVGIACIGLCLAFSLAAGVQWIDRVNHPPEVEHTEELGQETHATGDEGAGAEGSASDEAPVAGDSEQSESSEATEGEAHHEVPPVLTETTWFTIGGHDYKVGTFVDGLSVMMMIVVSTISLLVYVYSTDYVGGDRRYTHYFAFLSLFSASMLLLIMSRSTVMFITAWELVGVCSFALIGHWWEEKPNSDAALKAFLTNRVGDIGLLVGMIVLFFAAGSFDIVEINEFANGVTGGNDHLLLLVASCALIAAVMSKSGQFILHTWLPDAMAGPTPVSALIHAATMVVAGIFMVARLYSVFFEGLQIGGSNINLLAVVGAVTLFFGGLLAFVQNDIKKVLAYSTVSQLGYMVMGLGVGAWTAALFHLFTHAFFKAGLFLGSGSVAHAVHSFDMKQDMGGMRKFMPRTFATFVICSLALAAIVPFAGFWSKDEILAGASQLGGGGSGYPLMLVMGILGGGLTAAYMMRCIYLTFYGEPRGHAADPHHPPHESGPRILVPLYILAALAAITGLANLPGDGIFPESLALRFEHFVEPVAPYFPGELPTFDHPHFSWWVAVVSTVWAVLAAGIAFAYYWQGRFHGLTERSKVAHAGHTLLVQKYYFDHLYTGVIADGVKGPVARAAYWFNQNVLDGIVNGVASGTTAVARWTYKWIDQGVVDGTVNGSGAVSENLGQALRQLQTGKVQQYGALLFGGAVILAGIFVFAI